jgi:signal transduction histidine kinase
VQPGRQLKALWTGRNAEVREQIGDLDLSCYVDALRMEQVFRNLFENASPPLGP